MPGFDGTGPRGLGPMTGQGRGYCIQPIGTGYGYTTPDMPLSDIYRSYPGPFGARPHVFYPFGMAPYRVPFWGGRGRRSWGRGRFFGRGRGFGRRWW